MRPMRSLGRLWRGVTVLLAIPAAGLWAGESPTPSDDSIRFRLTADPATLDWNLARSSHETYVIMNIMEGLVEEGTDLKPRPALAEAWETSADGRTYTFHLRPGVKWSDGKPLRAQDFVDSWLRLIDRKTDSPYSTFLDNLEGAEAFRKGKGRRDSVGVRTVGDGSLQVKLRQPVPHFLHLLTFWVTFPVRTDLIRKHGAKWSLPPLLVTLGPYVVKEWSRGQSIVLERNPQYYALEEGRGPSVGRIEALVELNDRRARTLFSEGKLDFLVDATTTDVMEARESGKARVEQFPYLATYYLGFNVKSGPLKDGRVRKALTLAVDRSGIPARLQAGQIAAGGWFPPGMDGHLPNWSPQGALHDARGLLVKAGFPEGAGFPELTLWVEKFDGSAALAQLVVESLRDRLGVEIATHIASPAEYQRNVRGGRAALFIAHWGADFPDPINYLEIFQTGSGTNSTGWSSPAFDALLSKARATLDKKQRHDIYSEAERVLLDQEGVIMPLFYRKNAVLLSPRVKNFSLSPLNYLFLKDITRK